MVRGAGCEAGSRVMRFGSTVFLSLWDGSVEMVWGRWACLTTYCSGSRGVGRNDVLGTVCSLR